MTVKYCYSSWTIAGMDLTAVICVHELWRWEWRLPLLPQLGEGMVPLAVSSMLLQYTQGSADIYDRPSTPALWIYSHLTQTFMGEPMALKAAQSEHRLFGINGRWALPLGSWMTSLRSPLDGVWLPACINSFWVSCFLSKCRKSLTSGFSQQDGWFTPRPTAPSSSSSWGLEIENCLWQIAQRGNPFLTQHTLPTQYLFHSQSTDFRNSIPSLWPPDAWRQQYFLACLACLKLLGLSWETGGIWGNKSKIQFSFLEKEFASRHHFVMHHPCLFFVSPQLAWLLRLQSPSSRCFLPRSCTERAHFRLSDMSRVKDNALEMRELDSRCHPAGPHVPGAAGRQDAARQEAWDASVLWISSMNANFWHTVCRWRTVSAWRWGKQLSLALTLQPLQPLLLL